MRFINIVKGMIAISAVASADQRQWQSNKFSIAKTRTPDGIGTAGEIYPEDTAPIDHNLDIELIEPDKLVAAAFALLLNDWMTHESGNLDELTKILSAGADVNQQLKNGETLLTAAILARNINLLNFLIKNGADVNKSMRDGQSPLSLACNNNFKEIVNLLLENGADVNQVKNKWWSPMYIASSHGNKEIVTRLLKESGANVDQIDNMGGNTALYSAASVGSLEVVKVLLANGANPNLPGKGEGITPIHIAISKGHIDIIETLLKNGADANQATLDGRTPLSIAIKKRDTKIVTLLVESGASVDQDTDGVAPLHSVSHHGDVDLARLLLEHNATVDIVGKDGRTPLTIASQLGHEAMVRLLLDHNSSVDQGDVNGMTPLITAIQHNHINIVRLLLDNNATIDQGDKNGGTPLLFAIDYRYTDIVRLLLAYNASINQADKFGQTPLHFASLYDDLIPGVVRLLLENGADVNPKTKAGNTALGIAIKNSTWNAVRLLIQFGAINQRLKDIRNAGIALIVIKGSLIFRRAINKNQLEQKRIAKIEQSRFEQVEELKEISQSQSKEPKLKVKIKKLPDGLGIHCIYESDSEIPISESDYKKIEILQISLASQQLEIENLIEEIKSKIDESKSDEQLTQNKISLDKLNKLIEKYNDELSKLNNHKHTSLNYVMNLKKQIQSEFHELSRSTNVYKNNEELFNEVRPICKYLMNKDVPLTESVVKAKIYEINSKKTNETTSLYKLIRQVANTSVSDRSDEIEERMGNLNNQFDTIKALEELLIAETNQTIKRELEAELWSTIQAALFAKEALQILIKEQLNYLDQVKKSYDLVFFDGLTQLELLRFLKSFINEEELSPISVNLNNIKQMVDSDENGSYASSSHSTKTMSILSTRTADNKQQFVEIQQSIVNQIVTCSQAYDDEEGSRLAAKHMGLIRMAYQKWTPRDKALFTERIKRLRKTDGLQQQQTIFNARAHGVQKESKLYQKDHDKIKQDFINGLIRLNDEFKSLNLEEVTLTEHQMEMLVNLFEGHATKEQRQCSGSHYRLDYAYGVIIPSSITLLNPYDICDNWIRLKSCETLLPTTAEERNGFLSVESSGFIHGYDSVLFDLRPR